MLCQMFTGNPDIGKRILYAAYLDPGSGYIFSSVVPAVIGFLLASLGSLLLFFRNKIIPLLKKYWYIVLIILFLGLLSIIIYLVKSHDMKKTADRKVVILGLDGLDPTLVDEGIKENVLPNLKKLKENGYFSKLGTTVPPQSPVAWASFMTGDWPAKHGIYDFIERNSSDYSLDLVFSDPRKNPLRSSPFWEVLDRYNIPSTILFLPDTFPAAKFNGKMLSGMGTPDIIGTAGTFTFFSSKQYSLDPKWRGRFVKLSNNPVINTILEGPKFTSLGERKVTSIPFEIKKDKTNKTVTISIQNQEIQLKNKEFSSWVHLEFSVDFFTKIKGIVRFYLKEADPNIELYLSPINIDPENQVFPISSPKSYAKEITKDYGLYHTLGLPDDTWALEEGIFDEEAFLKDADEILNEHKNIILGELKKFQSGVFFGYFGTTDTMQHIYWRFLNDKNSKYQNTIMNYYHKVDEIVGETLKTLKTKDTLIILSDHGFNRFDYEFNVNTWLKDNGYLFLKYNKVTGGELFQDVDWAKTKAYSAGYNGIYFNLIGREKAGIVTSSEAKQLEKELRNKLLLIQNPFTSEKILKKVYTKSDLGISPTDSHSPDLFLGFYIGIRGSWDTAVGSVAKEEIVKRQTKWSGDHLFDPSEVPGVLFMNKKINKKDPKIIDIIPTTLHIFGIPSSNLDGKNLLN